MACVTKCCCCWSLKYGNFSYGIIVLIFRISSLFALWMSVPYVASGFEYTSSHGITSTRAEQLMFSHIGSRVGWLVATSACLFFALKGIIQKRSILLYPYIVVLILETIVISIFTILLSIMVSPVIAVILLVICLTHIYPLICLNALYKRMKQVEKSTPPMPMLTPTPMPLPYAVKQYKPV